MYDIKLCGLYPFIVIGWPFLNYLNNQSENHLNTTDSDFNLIITRYLNDTILSISNEQSILHSRNILLSKSEEVIKKQFEAQLAVSLNSVNFEVSEGSINCYQILSKGDKSFIDIAPDIDATLILSDDFLGNNKDINKDTTFLSTLAFMLSFDFIAKSDVEIKDLPLSKQKYPNLRTGDFRYRAPLTEIKNSLFNEIVPFSLVIIFGLMSVIFSFLNPIKQHQLDKAKSNEIASRTIGENVPMGQERSMLDSKIIELEDQLGDMSSVQSLSPIEWLETLSTYISNNVEVNIKSISITTSGLSFRGTFPDYPTSGKISTILEKIKSDNPDRFCEVNLKTDDVSIGVSGKQITAEILLCE